MERTFLMVKPDGIQRGLIAEVLSRFEKKGFQLIGAKFMQVSQEIAEKHYEEHRNKPFFTELVEFITSGPVFPMVWQGNNVILIARQMMGKTNPVEAFPGTIRGDYGLSIGMNIIHGSDSIESAKREISLWFDNKELIQYEKTIRVWI